MFDSIPCNTMCMTYVLHQRDMVTNMYFLIISICILFMYICSIKNTLLM